MALKSPNVKHCNRLSPKEHSQWKVSTNMPIHLILSRCPDIVKTQFFLHRRLRGIQCKNTTALWRMRPGTHNANFEPNSALFHILTIPSSDTVQISKEDEKCYKLTERQNGFTSMTVSAVTQKVVHWMTLIFKQLLNHELGTEADNNQAGCLIKRVTREYVKIRNYDWGNKYTEGVGGTIIRKQLSKSVS